MPTLEQFDRYFTGLILFLLPAISVLANKGVVPILIVLSLGLVLFDLVSKGRVHLPHLSRAPALVLTAFLAWLFLSLFWSQLPEKDVFLAVRLSGLIVCALFLIESLRNRDEAARQRLLKVLGIGVLFGLFILLLENQADAPITRLLKGKDFSEEINPSRFNFGSVFVCSLGWFLLAHNIERIGLKQQFFFLLALTALPFLTASESAKLASVFAFTWYVLFRPVPIPSARVLKFLVLISLVSLPLAAQTAWKATGPNIPDAMPSSAHHRLFIWSYVSDMIMEKPVTGFGIDASRHHSNSPEEGYVKIHGGQIVFRQDDALPLHPHNAAIQIWYELGAIGIAIVLAGLFLLVDATRQSQAPGTGRNRKSELLAQSSFVFLFIISMLSWGIWQNRWFAGLLFFAVLLLAFPFRQKDFLCTRTAEDTGKPAIKT